MEEFVWDEEQEGFLDFELEESLEHAKITETKVTLAGLLTTDHEPPLSVVKEVLRVVWRNMRNVRVVKSKERLYAITVEDEDVASRLISVNPWFVKGHTFTIKQ